MASPKVIARVQRLVWILTYAGLLTLVLGVATLRQGSAIGWLLVLAGGMVAAIGVALVWVRARMVPDADTESR